MTDQQQKPTLYERLGGYDAVYAFAGEVLKTCMKHPDTAISGRTYPNRRSRKSISTLSIFCASTGAATRSTGDEIW